MPSLHDLLDEAAGEARPFDIGADLHRGHRAAAPGAAAGQWSRPGCMVGAGAVTIAALPHGGGRVGTLPSADGGSASPVRAIPGLGRGTAEVATTFQTATGWHIVGERPQYVMLTRDGSGVTTIDSGFVGQIVVMLSPGGEGLRRHPGSAVTGVRRPHVLHQRTRRAARG